MLVWKLSSHGKGGKRSGGDVEHNVHPKAFYIITLKDT